MTALAGGPASRLGPQRLLATPRGTEKASVPLAGHRPSCLACSLPPPRSALSTRMLTLPAHPHANLPPTRSALGLCVCCCFCPELSFPGPSALLQAGPPGRPVLPGGSWSRLADPFQGTGHSEVPGRISRAPCLPHLWAYYVPAPTSAVPGAQPAAGAQCMLLERAASSPVPCTLLSPFLTPRAASGPGENLRVPGSAHLPPCLAASIPTSRSLRPGVSRRLMGLVWACHSLVTAAPHPPRGQGVPFQRGTDHLLGAGLQAVPLQGRLED